MRGPAQRLVAALVLGRKARVDVFHLVADLLEAGFSLERALEIAARVAEMRDRQLAAVWKALAMPAVLAVGLLVLLWAAGGHFIPIIETVSPPEEWSAGARLFRSVSVWLYGNTPVVGSALAGLVALTAALMLTWTGPGRTVLDRIAPFSLYRTLTGSAFLFVVMEFLAAGIDVNDRAFDALKRAASPYTRHRIASIQGFMARGAGLGRSMVLGVGNYRQAIFTVGDLHGPP